MADKLNKLRNPAFRIGKDAPAHWDWIARRRQARWDRPPVGGVRITTEQATGEALLRQAVRCKPDQFYRIEATVRCDLSATDQAGGLVLGVRAVDADEEGERRTPPILRADQPTVIRTFYRAGPATRELEVSVGIVQAAGEATVAAVRMIPILEPDELSHPMAMPPPPRCYPPPRSAQSICICSATAATRRLTGLLGEYFPHAVEARTPDQWSPKDWFDAVILPDAAPHRAIRTLSALKRLSEDRIVIVSLPAFAAIAGSSLSLQRIEQPDDPIHAEVLFANHATAGFALHDVFPYAWSGRQPGSFRQNHFRKTDGFTRFCKRHEFIPLLASMCDKDRTSHQPMALHRATEAGGLYVFDIEPAEAEASNWGEPVLAMHVLLNILGHGPAQIGQFVSPTRQERHFRDMIREFAVRTEHIRVHDVDAPAAEVTEQLVTIGGEDQTFGLPLRPKPLILIRSGLTSGDFESVYGVWVWLKQFIRPAPHACCYAQALASQFRIAWIPCAAPWESGDGWQRRSRQPRVPMAVDTEDCEIAALIDVAAHPTNSVRIISDKEGPMHSKYARWLPRLFDSFVAGDFFCCGPEAGRPLGNRHESRWGRSKPSLECVVDGGSFQEDAHRDVQGCGGTVTRIEVPGHGADFVAHSIARTDLTATVLEHVLGLQYGLLAVNRRLKPIDFDGFPPLASGEALVVRSDDASLQLETLRAS